MGEKQKLNFLDGLGGAEIKQELDDWIAFKDRISKNSSSFHTKRGIFGSFFTDHSKLYYTPEEYRTLKKGLKIARITKRIDALSSAHNCQNRINLAKKEDWMFLSIKRRYANLRNYTVDLIQGATHGVSAAKMWNLSIVGAVIFGMLSMTMIYRYLGQNVSAKIQENDVLAQEESQGQVLGADYDINEEIDTDYITRILEGEQGGEKIGQQAFEKEIREMVAGYPIEKMVPEIVKQNRIVAAFLVAIAKKESNWGKRVPVLNGQDCFNYWGYRGIRDRMGTGGHTCFDGPKDAVETVGRRIEYLVSETQRNTPDKMVVWKCGYDCSWDNKVAVKKWISDVDLYFQKLNKSN